MWLIYDPETGEQVGEWVEAEPTPQNGLGYVAVAPSALAGISRWVPALRGFADWPALDADGVYNLFTADEKAAILTCGVAEVTGLVLALRFTTGLIRPNDPFHQQGVALLAGLGLLTEARAARVLAMLPPEGEP